MSPSELFLKCRLRTRLDLLRPSVAEHIARQQDLQKYHHDARNKAQDFDVGQSVMVENMRGGPKWLPGTVLEKAGPVPYRVQVGDMVWRRHTDQLLQTPWRRHTDQPMPAVVSELPPTVPTVPLVQTRPYHQSATEKENAQQSPTREVESNPEILPTDITTEPTLTTRPSYPKRERHPPDRFSPSLN